jgi:hypothetical protein
MYTINIGIYKSHKSFIYTWHDLNRTVHCIFVLVYSYATNALFGQLGDALNKELALDSIRQLISLVIDSRLGIMAFNATFNNISVI